VPRLPDLLQLAWSAAAAAAAATRPSSSSSSSGSRGSSSADASTGFLVHLVRAHSELRQLDRLFKAVYESLPGLTAAAAAIGSSAGSSRDEMRSVAERQAVAAAAGVVSSRSFLAAVRQAVADAPTGGQGRQALQYSTAGFVASCST
jgi:hypothetical protein